MYNLGDEALNVRRRFWGNHRILILKHGFIKGKGLMPNERSYSGNKRVNSQFKML